MRLIDADELKGRTTDFDEEGYRIWHEWDIDNAPTVDRPQGELAERALEIIDRLRTDGHINNKEQGTLRRAILLPERPQGEWD